MGAKGLRRSRLKRLCYDVSPHLTERMMTILEEAKAEGKAETLQRQLVRRFGTVSAQAQAQINTATLEQLDGWLDEVLDADSVEAAPANGSAGPAR